MADGKQQQQVEPVRAYLEYFRDMGVYDFYQAGEPGAAEPMMAEPVVAEAIAVDAAPIVEAMVTEPEKMPVAAVEFSAESVGDMGKLVSLTDIAPAAAARVGPSKKVSALKAIHDEIGDCTRCPLAYGGRHKIVFADGDPNARLMFVGEGPGADEDAQGLPFVGKSGQLLNNMIVAMGLRREDVYIANIVKCRPPANRAPEWVEASTCAPFLARQMDVVQPEVVVALGATAAMYLLGVKQSLISLRGRWHEVRGAKAVVTYHPAFLLRDPRQKGEAWKDLQMVMKEMGLKGK